MGDGLPISSEVLVKYSTIRLFGERGVVELKFATLKPSSRARPGIPLFIRHCPKGSGTPGQARGDGKETHFESAILDPASGNEANLAQAFLQVIIRRDGMRIAIGVFGRDALRQCPQGKIAAQMQEERHRIAAVSGAFA